jgi:hypothetical protein
MFPSSFRLYFGFAYVESLFLSGAREGTRTLKPFGTRSLGLCSASQHERIVNFDAKRDGVAMKPGRCLRVI